MKKFILILSSILFLFSCKKEINSLPIQRNVFVNTDWVITSNIIKYNTHNLNATENGNVEFEENFASECKKDDVQKFSSDNIFRQLPGLNNCGGINPPKYKWEITDKGNITFIKIDSTSITVLDEGQPWEVQNFSEESFDMYRKEEDFGTGQKSVHVITLTAQ